MTITERIRSFAPLILVAALAAGALAGAVAAKNAPPKYEASVTFTVDQRQLEDPEDYAYDGYYALRATEIFADTVVSWFHTPSVHAHIRALAESADEENIGIPKRLDLDVKKYSGHAVIAAVTSKSYERTRLIAQTTIGVITARAKELAHNAEGESQFLVSAEKPVIEEKRFPATHAGIIGGSLGLVLAAIALFFITPPRKKNDR